MSTYQELRAMLKCDPVDWASIAQRLGCSPEPLAVCAALLDQYGMKTYGPYIRCPYCTTISGANNTIGAKPRNDHHDSREV